jgi:Zn-dependent protease
MSPCKELPVEPEELYLHLVRHLQTERNLQRSFNRDKAGHAIPASLPLFRVFGVPVQAHFTWALFIAGVLAWSIYDEGSLEAGKTMGIILVMLFGSMLLHEFAHAFVARLFKYHVRRILLLPFACTTELEVTPGSWHEIWVALAGPMTNIALAAGSLAALQHFWRHRGVLSLLHKALAAHTLGSLFFVFNLWIAGINLIPCFPLDGGRILRSLLTLLIKRASKGGAKDSFLVASRISVRYVALPIAGFFLGVCFHHHDWTDLVLIGLIIFAGHQELSAIESTQEDERCSKNELASQFANAGDIPPLLS